MTSPLTYYRKIRNEQHVFIYCVAGRSSSTAFQRIVNSTNAIWIWGEQHGIINQLASSANLVKQYHSDPDVKNSLVQMYNSYTLNKHVGFYPNAIGNLDTTGEIICSAISNLLKPWASSIKRFGFKDIDASPNTLNFLKQIFPESLFVFCFRDPLLQWPSVQASGWWPYCKDVHSFLYEYQRLSHIYLDYASKNNITAFVENIDLRNHAKVQMIRDYLNIPSVDNELINLTVSSNTVIPLSDADKKAILNSEAYATYLKMKQLSESFFNDENN